MRKLKPTYPLQTIRELIENDRVKLTVAAVQGAHSLGLSETETKKVVYCLSGREFYKSITGNNEKSVWQDVYKKRVNGVGVYIKMKIAQVGEETLLILSFKRDEDLVEGNQ